MTGLARLAPVGLDELIEVAPLHETATHAFNDDVAYEAHVCANRRQVTESCLNKHARQAFCV